MNEESEKTGEFRLKATETMDFTTFFRQATQDKDNPNGFDPFPYQIDFAESPDLPNLINVPTGVGKTATVILGWLWRYRYRQPTPRRLIYCLPMRVLVEQTRNEAIRWLFRLGLLDADPAFDLENLTQYRPALGNTTRDKTAVHVLMGGENVVDWHLYPERPAILIGTQDMLLSRALNRGYAASRYRWPMHFGLLNNDCLWVMDEVQLMGSGLLTTAQLAAFAEKLWRQVVPCKYLWMSATLGESFLNTRDRRDWEVAAGNKLALSPERDLAVPAVQKRLRASKSIQIVNSPPKGSKVLDEHLKNCLGRLSLLVYNTVPGAMKAFSELTIELEKPARRKKAALPEIGLLHGRFRSIDRQRQLESVEDFASKMDKTTGAVAGHSGFILVSTQVVEAGFDISSVRLWSEIAPWPSDVQRLGRLNREGAQPNAVATFWMPKGDKDRENSKESPNANRIGPYDKKDLETADRLLKAVVAEMESGTEYRDALDKVIQTEVSKQALEIVADMVIRPEDFHELFSTEPDLTGGFTNISQFVRDADRNVDVQVFWRDFEPEKAQELDQPRPQRNELCSVPFFELRRFLGNKGTAWEWNSEANAKSVQQRGTGAWEKRRPAEIMPGMTLLLPRSAGGYSENLGWTGSPADKPKVYPILEHANDGLNRDPESSAEHWCLLSHHLADVEAEANELLAKLGLDNSDQGKAVAVAARWHDWGKSVMRWQKAVVDFTDRVRMQLEKIKEDPTKIHFHPAVHDWLAKWSPPKATLPQWAKFPNVTEVWKHSSLSRDERLQFRRYLSVAFSPGLRHEVASALGAWDAWLSGDKQLSALAVYLILSHHGKARTVLRSTQDEDEVFGLLPKDSLHPVPGFFDQEVQLQFTAKHVGAHGTWNESGTVFQMTSPSWTEVMAELLGPVGTHEATPGMVIPDGEPHHLGPFVLAYLETILRVADARASRNPGKGGRP